MQLAYQVIVEAMPPLLASVLSPVELEVMRQRLNALPEPPPRPQLSKDNWLGGLAVFLLVFLSTLPVVVPFLFVEQAHLALKISNGIAIAMLFVTGYAFGRYAGRGQLRMGVTMVIIGGAFVGLTRALGG
jgi:VIT1/CCC1 family predicted Fe2+/Mn2+ transporter